MKRQLHLHTSSPAEAVFKNLRVFESDLPPGSRVRPDHTYGVQVSLAPPAFGIEYRRGSKDWLAPVCKGVVRSTETGSTITAVIRTGRTLLILPTVWLLVFTYGWFHRGSLDLGGAILILVACIGLGVMAALQTSFSVANHEAQADGLEALLRHAAKSEAPVV